MDKEVAFLVGDSAPMKRLRELIQQVAQVDFSLLVTGETGSGKELVARAVHRSGPRWRGPFVPVNCAAIPDALLEAELFGHRRGAFTGASGERAGLVAAASGGTLFLDEIGDMPLLLQAKLLRLLQEGEFRPLGENRLIHVDLRVISATHQNLRLLVERGAFRQDLFYRVQDLVVDVPPLRARREDIPQLVEHFLAKYGRGNRGDMKPTLAGGLAACLMRHDWPGNVRELESEVKRAVTFGLEFHGTLQAVGGDRALPAIRRVWERSLLMQALEEHGWSRSRTAKSLCVSRQTLYGLMKKHGIGGRGGDRRL